MRAPTAAFTLASTLFCSAQLRAQTTPADAPLAVVHRLYDCVNRHSIDECMPLYADTIVVLPDDDSIAHRVSRAEVRAVVGKFLADNPRARVKVSLTAIGPFVTAREQLVNWPNGKTQNGVDVYDIRNGKVMGLWELPELPRSAK